MRTFNKIVTIAASLIIFVQSSFGQEIFEAAQQGNLEKIKTVLAKNPELINARDKTGETPLHISLLQNQKETAAYLISEKANINIKNNNEQTPLFYAASKGHKEIAEMLLKRGADLKEKDKFGRIPLHYAAMEGKSELVKLFLTGSIINLKDNGGLTPLNTAVLGKNIEATELLLKFEADPDIATEPYGYSPLHYAVMNGSFDIAELLIKNGANVNIHNVWGTSPLHSTASSNRIKEAELLIINGANPNIKDGNGKTPLHNASSRGHKEIIQFLLENNANINVKDNWDFTPLHIAAENNRGELVSLLIENKADINIADKSGQTPLHRAAISGYPETVELLFTGGADINVQDAEGRTPLFYAARYGHKKVADLLKTRGAQGDGLIENYGYFPFSKKEPGNGEACIWYLGHSGWAVKTKDYLLIFDYWENKDLPPKPLLANGFINVPEIEDRNVIVFISHSHGDHFDKKILEWEKKLKNITYIFGWKALENPEYIYMGPRIKKQVHDLEIECIHSPEAGVLEGNFLLRVNGLTIYHSGDYSRGHDTFKKDMDYLAETAGEIDLFFMLAGGRMDNKEALIALEKVKPQYMFPMHAGGSEYVFKTFAQLTGEKKITSKIICARNRGDSFIYRKGEIK